MEYHCHTLPYKNTRYFSGLVTDYLEAKDAVKPFVQDFPSMEALQQAVIRRDALPVDREALVAVLHDQYRHLPVYEAVHEQIEALRQPNTYTVVTAHQPNIFTGHLYFVYKIVHAINLAAQLNQEMPGKHFVPVYYMGAEDNDLEEIGTVHLFGNTYRWASGEKGATGRMKAATLKPILDDIFRYFGPPGEAADELKAILEQAYLHHETLAEATAYLVNFLFGEYGLVVINPDDARLKRAFIPVMKDELLNHNAYGIVTETSQQLEAQYKAQAFPREINLFYLHDQLRERIVREGDTWKVNDTNISFTEETLLQELEAHPERFSPNVILRGLYQETILPNVAFVGGGGELAYWLQLKGIFDFYKVPFPVLLLRNSVLWSDAKSAGIIRALGLSWEDAFGKPEALFEQYVQQHGDHAWQLQAQREALTQLTDGIREKAAALDTTLIESTAASHTRMMKQLDRLEHKLFKAEKRKFETVERKISGFKQKLFPAGSLQERYDNFIPFYLEHGRGFIDALLKAQEPMGTEFLIVEVQEHQH